MKNSKKTNSIGNKITRLVKKVCLKKTNNMSEVKASFIFNAAKLDFDYITQLLKISPTEIQLAESIKIKEFQRDSWIYSCGYEKSTDINVQVEKVLLPFVNKAKEINEICDKFNAKVQVSVYIEVGRTNPWIALMGENISQMARLNVYCFDIDMY